MTTYTIINPTTGDVEASGLSAEDAAHRILTDDSQSYEILDTGNESALMVSRRRGQPFTQAWDGPNPHGKPIFEFGGTPAERETRIWARVVKADWSRINAPEAVTDEDYAARLAEIAAEENE